MGTGRNKKAIIALQRAVRYNPHDADALSMLGEFYALENKGNEIALSLCQQAVNIDDRHWKYWYRLALVRFRMASYESAMGALRESMQLERKNGKHYISSAGYMIKWGRMLRRQKYLRL